MRTAARRDQILHILYRSSTTVGAIAGRFGVSERTVYRDIAALRDAGHDIRAAPGPGGGVSIAPGARPRAVHFEVSEIVGLALSVAILRATPHAPFTPSAEAALDRARMALSPERRRAMRRLERRILVGVPSTERVRASAGQVAPGLVAVFERCFTRDHAMAFDYVDGEGAASRRHVECIALLHHAPVWYIVGWDLDKDASRTFRMDRISGAQCGEALREPHALSEVMPERSEGDDAWRRRPLG